VEWDRGRLEVLAAGTRMDVLGTRLAVAVDSTGNTGFVYVESGTVIFPDFPGTVLNAGDVFTLQRGAAPVRVDTNIVPRDELARAVEFNHRQIWSGFRPFFLKPFFYVPAGLVTAGVIGYVATRDGDKRGSIVIRIPFE
jgi:hypothetical protein